jgi:hypothetical protein
VSAPRPVPVAPMVALTMLTWILLGFSLGLGLRDRDPIAALCVLGAAVAVMFLRRSLERWWNEREKERS